MKVNTRSWSGILPVAVALEGNRFSCKYDCSFCPNECVENGAEKTIARSYLSSEGTFLRGNMAGFDAYSQIIRRLLELESMGHYPDKLEIIVLGGTFSCYDKKYRMNFIRDVFYACNVYRMFSAYFNREFYEDVTLPWLQDKPFFNKIPLSEGFYNVRKCFSLQDEKRLNELGNGVRIVGLVLETRPDTIAISSMFEMRRLGCTRVQLGIQHVNANVLDLNNRQHGPKASVLAIKKLKDNGFKVDGHIMPDLPFSNIMMDYEMVREVFCSPEYQCDYVKIYPCLDLPFTKARQWKHEGIWEPYAERDYVAFVEFLAYTCTIVPPWTRINRIHRDFPKASPKNQELGYVSQTVETNLNQFVCQHLEKTGRRCFDIRSREIKHDTIDNFESCRLYIRRYRQDSATEFFISLEQVKSKSCHDFDDTILLGFLRLRILDKDTSSIAHCLPSLRRTSIARIRELHVYGYISGTTCKSSIQHLGIGKMLMSFAEFWAMKEGCSDIAVISGVGVRNYYRKLGYNMKSKDEGEYMFKALSYTLPFFWMGFFDPVRATYLLFCVRSMWLHRRARKVYIDHRDPLGNSPPIGMGECYVPIIMNTMKGFHIVVIVICILSFAFMFVLTTVMIQKLKN
jgi:ELP3 family radical SAM enzyme/protein acetyltransferase